MDEKADRKKIFWRYAGYIAATLGIGSLSALLSRDGMEAFSYLKKPAFAPPDWVFPAAWTLLYILMAVSAAMVGKEDSNRSRDALFVYWAQLFVNFWWSILFFAWGLRLIAFFWLILLLALAAVMAFWFGKIRPIAGKLNIPYLLWLVFAGVLNISVYILNK